MSGNRRGRFEGVLNVIRFNYPMYIVSIASACTLAALAGYLPGPVAWVCAIGAVGALYLTVVSLLVSYWVYDVSPYYEMDWLDRLELPESVASVLNVHSGFDETSCSLRQLYPNAVFHIYDFYDPTRHTEPSIRRARAECPPLPGTETVRIGALPVERRPVDLVFGLLALHEIRDAAERVILLKELRASLTLGGSIIVVEHLRDLPNFLAFGPGFFHFHSRNSWLQAFREAGLERVREFSITPFLRLFHVSAAS